MRIAAAKSAAYITEHNLQCIMRGIDWTVYKYLNSIFLNQLKNGYIHFLIPTDISVKTY